MKSITFFNNKGGVGKTTLAVNIASYFSTRFDKKILLVDADPQANSTQMIIKEDDWLDFYGENATRPTILDYLKPILEGDSSLNFGSQPLPSEENRFEVDLIPSHPWLSIIEDVLSDSWNKCISGDLGGFRKTNWLKSLIKSFYEQYDFLFIDVGPSLGALNRSILLNSDFIITPMGSDIFSLIGISNISTWIRNWMTGYKNAIRYYESNMYSRESLKKFPINLEPENTTRLIGFSIQQYVTRSFSTGRRPVAAYESIIRKIPDQIMEHLNYLIYDNLNLDNLNLGDIPYLYSLVPLAQSNNAPMYDLKSSDGLVGSQTGNVKKYSLMLETISKKILSNIGESYVDQLA